MSTDKNAEMINIFFFDIFQKFFSIKKPLDDAFYMSIKIDSVLTRVSHELEKFYARNNLWHLKRFSSNNDMIQNIRAPHICMSSSE